MTHWTLRRRSGCVLLMLLLAWTGGANLWADPPAPAPARAPAEARPATTDEMPDPLAPVDEAVPDKAPTDADADAEPPKPRPSDDKETLELMKVFVDSLDQIDRNYVKPIDRRELVEAAIEGMLERLDPYSSYIAPSDVERFRGAVENQFGGIGIQVNMEDGHLKIVSPLVGTPAYRAGLMAGDTVVEINGEDIKGITLDAAVNRLKGPIGTKVSMTVIHAGAKARETVTMTREIVHVESVLGDHRQADDSWDFMLDHQKRLGYIRIVSFGRETAADLRRALTDLQKQKMRGLVLDLRFNPGGLLTSAIETCDLLIDKGRIVSTKGRNTPERVWDAKAEGTFGGFPVAVLVNHYSASASEIVSACLQDHKRAVVVGQRTWGKGSVQNVIDLEGGRSVLKLTTASYWRPSGHNIHRFPDAKDSDEWGVKPDPNYEVVLKVDEVRQLVEDRRHRDIVPAHLPPVSSHPAAAAGGAATPPVAQPNGKPVGAALPDHPANKPGAATPTAPQRAAPADAKRPHDEGHPQPTGPFVDRQLKRALEYLDVEIARAG